MKNSALAVLAAVMIAVPALAAPPRGQPVPSQPSRPAIELVSVSRVEFDRRLDRLERVADELAKPHGHDRRDVRELKRELAELRRMLRDAPVYREDPRPIPPPHYDRAVVSNRELDQIRHAVTRESFSKDQLMVLSSATASRYFSVEQSQQLLRIFSFSSDRLKALEMMAPRMVDLRERGYVLYESFDSRSDKEKARKHIERNI